MDQIRQILEHLSRKTDLNKTARLMAVSRITIRDYRSKCDATGLSPSQLLEPSYAELSALICSKLLVKPTDDDKRLRYIDSRSENFEAELNKTWARKKLLWEEHL